MVTVYGPNGTRVTTTLPLFCPSWSFMLPSNIVSGEVPPLGLGEIEYTALGIGLLY